MNKKKQKPQRKRQKQGGTKSKKNSSTTSSNWALSVQVATGLAVEPGAEEAEEITETKRGQFSPGEIGQIAPLDQEGEGNRQNAETAELEQIEPDLNDRR